MDGVADVEELQGPDCRRGEGQEAEVHKPAGPGTPRGPRSGPFGRARTVLPPCSFLILGIHGCLLAIWVLQSSVAAAHVARAPHQAPRMIGLPAFLARSFRWTTAAGRQGWPMVEACAMSIESGGVTSTPSGSSR